MQLTVNHATTIICLRFLNLVCASSEILFYSLKMFIHINISFQINLIEIINSFYLENILKTEKILTNLGNENKDEKIAYSNFFYNISN